MVIHSLKQTHSRLPTCLSEVNIDAVLIPAAAAARPPLSPTRVAHHYLPANCLRSALHHRKWGDMTVVPRRHVWKHKQKAADKKKRHPFYEPVSALKESMHPPFKEAENPTNSCAP